MNRVTALWQFGSAPPAAFPDAFNFSSDAWFAVAAIVILLAYVSFARDSADVVA